MRMPLDVEKGLVIRYRPVMQPGHDPCRLLFVLAERKKRKNKKKKKKDVSVVDSSTPCHMTIRVKYNM